MIVTIVEDRYLTQLAPHRGTVAPAAQTHKFKTHVGACARASWHSSYVPTWVLTPPVPIAARRRVRPRPTRARCTR